MGNGNLLTIKREHAGQGVSPGQSAPKSVLKCVLSISEKLVIKIHIGNSQIRHDNILQIILGTWR